MTAVAVKERPILVSTKLVPPILRDEKTNTRRLRGLEEVNQNPDEWSLSSVGPWALRDDQWSAFFNNSDRTMGLVLSCPYGSPGERLWVREAWTTWNDEMDAPLILYRADRAAFHALDKDDPVYPLKGSAPHVWLPADYNPLDDPQQEEPKWRPSIHMPRAASRIDLELTRIDCQRLHDITEEDAEREGFRPQYSPAYVSFGEIVGADGVICIDQFRNVWVELNGEPSWKLNPWVWSLHFRRLDTTNA